MSGLARPGAVASVLVAAALAIHPALGASRWLPGHSALLAALSLLAALAAVARAASAREGRPGAVLLAAGAVALVAALGVDGLRGHHGTLTLVPGQVRPHFDEAGPDGRALGLRPLGFPIGAERVAADGAVGLALPGGGAPAELTPEHSVAFGGYRFAQPRAASSGGATRLRIAASDGSRSLVVDVAPGAPGRADDLTIALDQYFADFALDDSQQPYSRSSEPRNPAALLTVERGGQSYRAFVLQSMPGVHRVEPLGLAFSLLEVEPERTVEIEVHREPAALAVLVGVLLLAAGVALTLRASPSRPTESARDDLATPALVAGCALVALLLLVDGGSVLAWSFGLATAAGRVPLAGVGVLLGAALIAALGGSLLLAAERLAGDGNAVRPLARGGLWLALGLAGAGVLLALVRVSALPAGTAAARPLAGLSLAAIALAGSLLATRAVAAPLVSRLAPYVLPLAALAAVVLAAAAGILGVRRDGTYATPVVTAAAAAALLGLAALEPSGVPGLRRLAFLLALLTLAIA